MLVPYVILVVSSFGHIAPSVAAVNNGTSAHIRENPFESIPQVEKNLKKWVNSGVKLALPYLMSTVTEIRMSSECTKGFLKLMRDVMDIRDWAFKMLDALGKPSAGILEGTATALGDYDECLDISAPHTRRKRRPSLSDPKEDFRGQYCMIQIDLPDALRQAAIDYQAGNRSGSLLANSKTFLRSLVKIAPRADVAFYRLGVCIPSVCNMDDLQSIVNEVEKYVKVQLRTLRCETKHSSKVSTEQIIILTIFGLFCFLLFLGTSFDTILRYKSPEELENYAIGKKGSAAQLILTFSIANNLKKLSQLQANRVGKIACVRGMRFISVCMYVVVSTYATPHDFHFLKYRSAFHFYRFMEEWWFTVFANASAGIDTLFFISGLQITYSTWKKYGNKDGKLNFSPLRFLAIWFSRLALVQLLVIALFMCLPLLGRGPIWADVVTPEIEKCRSRWWMNVLFINNFWPSNETCLSHMWIVSALMHLVLLAPIIYYVLSRWTSVGMIMVFTLIVGSSVAIAMVTLINDLPPAPAFYFLSFLNLSLIWDRLFIQAYDHLSPFCVGILLGYYMARCSRPKLSKVAVTTGWGLAILCNMAVMCGLYGYRHGESMEMTLSAVYAAVHRFAWSLGIAWIVFACWYGYGGVVNSILSSDLFIPLDRLSNLVYLLNPLILYLHGGQIREKMYMAHIDQAMYATAYIVFTVALAAVCYIAFYLPFLYVESKIWSTKDIYECEEKCETVSDNSKELVTRCDMVSVDLCSKSESKSTVNGITWKTDSNSLDQMT